MNYKNYQSAVESDYGPDVARLTMQLLTIMFFSYMQDPDNLCTFKSKKKTAKIFKAVFWEEKQSDFETALQCFHVYYDWDIKNSMRGLGGCIAETPAQLVAKLQKQTEE